MTRRRNRRPRTAALAAATAAATGLTCLAALPAQAAAPRVPALPGDFDGDGRRDLALGMPGGTVSGVASGFVAVAYGGASGPDTADRQVISQSSAGIPGGSEQGDRFGAALASADFDLDGYADLAVLAAGENDNGPMTAGEVTLVYGSAAGLSSRAVRFAQGAMTLSTGDFDRNGRTDLAVGRGGSLVVYGDLAAGDLTGTIIRTGQGEGETATVSTAAADFTGDGYADLAIGVVWPPIDGEDDWIRLNVYPGSDGGVATTPAFSSTDVRTTSLAAGDVDGDGKADLVAGVPSATGGEVRVFRGTASGVAPATVIDQDTAGVPGTQEPNDGFASSVAVGDVNGDGRADVAAGAPQEDIGAVADAGAATVLYGGPGGLTGTGAQQFSQNTAGVPGGAEQDDAFGGAVALADLNGDGKGDLTAGAPGENGTEGALYMFDGTASGATTTGVRAFGSDGLGVQGRSARLGGVILP